MSARRATYNGRRRDERGVALVEFALLLPFIALLVMGTVDVGRAYSLQNRLKNASREGAAYAQIKPTRVDSCVNGGTATITKRVTDEDSDLASQPGFAVSVDASGSSVIGCGGSVATGTKLKVNVSADFDVLTPFVGIVTGDPIRMKGTTEVIVQ